MPRPVRVSSGRRCIWHDTACPFAGGSTLAAALRELLEQLGEDFDEEAVFRDCRAPSGRDARDRVGIYAGPGDQTVPYIDPAVLRLVEEEENR